MIYDCIIIGGGPAGLTAGLYAARAGLNAVIIEGMFLGGQVLNTFEVDNYPGLPKISGSELVAKMSEHLKEHETKIISDDVLDIVTEQRPFVVKCQNDSYCGKTVIVTTGAKPRKLDVKGEEQFTGRGVSYCATCDGAFYRDKQVVVLGSGNTAVEDATFLARIAKKVTLISRSAIFKGDARSLAYLKSFDNVSLLNNYTAHEIIGANVISNIVVKNVSTGELLQLDADGIFVAVGIEPATNLLDGKVDQTPSGYIITDKYMSSSVNGIFVAGDARDTPLRQVVTAVSDGAVAAFYAAVNISY